LEFIWKKARDAAHLLEHNNSRHPQKITVVLRGTDNGKWFS
jgi:hypothetical protein